MGEDIFTPKYYIFLWERIYLPQNTIYILFTEYFIFCGGRIYLPWNTLYNSGGGRIYLPLKTKYSGEEDIFPP